MTFAFRMTVNVFFYILLYILKKKISKGNKNIDLVLPLISFLDQLFSSMKIEQCFRLSNTNCLMFWDFQKTGKPKNLYNSIRNQICY